MTINRYALIDFIEECYKTLTRYKFTLETRDHYIAMAYGAVRFYCKVYYETYGYDDAEIEELWDNDWRNRFYELLPTAS